MEPTEDALDQLAAPYATLLRLRAAHASDELIAQAIAVPVEALSAMAALAESKLERLRATDDKEDK